MFYAPPGFGPSYVVLALYLAWSAMSITVVFAVFQGFRNRVLAWLGTGLGILVACVVVVATLATIHEQGMNIDWYRVAASALPSVAMITIPIWQRRVVTSHRPA